MKKIIKRGIVLSLTLSLILSSSFILKASIKEGEATGTITERVLSFNQTEATCLMFTPDDSELLGRRATTNPVIIVFGNEDYTEETAKKTAENSGLAKIAKDEGCVIAFVNWSNVSDENAVNLYKNVAVMYSDDTSNTYVDGFWSNIMPDSNGNEVEQGRYSGTGQRIYIYGDGDGADYVIKNILTANIPSAMLEATVTLFNPSISIDEKGSDLEIPVAVVNAVDGTEEILKSYSDDESKYLVETSSITSGFDKETLISVYNDLSGKYRRQLGYIVEIPDYEEVGIIETIEITELSNGEIEYYQFIPDDIDMETEETVPLVMIFHGGGNHAEYQAWASGWPLVGKEDGFMVISVNDHVNKTASDIIELLDYLLDKYPALDSSKVYSAGYSMGSAKTWDIAEQYPDRLAGIAPMSGSFEATEDIPDFIIPVFYVAGEDTPLVEFPSQSNKGGEVNDVDTRMNFVLKMNKITDSYNFDINANEWWGIAPDEVEQINDTIFAESILTMNKFESEDGNIYTVFGNCSNKGHDVFGFDNKAAWNFLSQFSRNSDGSISIEGDSKVSTILIFAIPIVVVLAAISIIIIKKRKKSIIKQ